ATIAPYKYPRRIEFVDGLPRTESGKIRRFVLRQREAERARAAPPPQVFETVIPVRFHHVDAAGIVFYPRYFEMINQVVEDWFGSALGLAFAEMHRRDHHGVPTARIDCEFLRPSRLGDALRFALRVERLGGSSCTLRIEASCDGEARLRANAVLVHVDLEPDIAPLPWPAPLRDAMRPYLPSA
ncbi:MAG TPA: thioesterase family protein, partial [Alphaproteobacteria bacterium]|nr:thioesterase family protein [Alphaproteobacteria bacterium]